MPCPRGCCRTERDHYRSLTFATSVLVDGNRSDRVLSADLAAYKRLVQSGLEPKGVNDCARLEATGAPAYEIEGRPPDVNDC